MTIEYNPKNDYYELLMVNPKADSEVIKAAHKARMLKIHPDLNNGKQELAKKINNAKDVLLNDSEREYYDKLRVDYWENLSGDNYNSSEDINKLEAMVKYWKDECTKKEYLLNNIKKDPVREYIDNIKNCLEQNYDSVIQKETLTYLMNGKSKLIESLNNIGLLAAYQADLNIIDNCFRIRRDHDVAIIEKFYQDYKGRGLNVTGEVLDRAKKYEAVCSVWGI